MMTAFAHRFTNLSTVYEKYQHHPQTKSDRTRHIHDLHQSALANNFVKGQKPTILSNVFLFDLFLTPQRMKVLSKVNL
ncbi:hypothetical protein [Bartonella sp. MU70NMGDW]|uniref:hypothetical protein n=1 Tax=Bartonella sp. MU70NMGDW TaxID=3243561 RepID=UPI0035D13558